MTLTDVVLKLANNFWISLSYFEISATKVTVISMALHASSVRMTNWPYVDGFGLF